VQAIENLCAEFGVSLAAAALQYPLRALGVDTVLVGARTAAEIDQDAELLDVPIPAELWAALEHV